MADNPNSRGDTVDPTFEGFEHYDATFVFCPNQFLDHCINQSGRGVVRVVGHILYQTLRWVDGDGQPVNEEIPVGYKELIQEAGVSRGAVRPTLTTAVSQNYVQCVGVAEAASAGNSGAKGRYQVAWNSEYTATDQTFAGFYSGPGPEHHTEGLSRSAIRTRGIPSGTLV